MSCAPQGRILGSADDASAGGDDGGHSPRYDFSVDPNGDSDHDGFTPAQGDCNDRDPLVGPMAVEVADNGVDDDCDGTIDNVTPPCDAKLSGMKDAAALAGAIGLCDKRFLLTTALTAADPTAVQVLPDYGTSYLPKEGSTIAAMSTGVAARKMDKGYVSPQEGTAFSAVAANPDLTIPVVTGCGQNKQPANVNDMTTFEVKLKVPQNAASFSFSFVYDSAEYPEYVCTKYNDAFLVELQSKKYPTFQNVSFDSAGHPITINNALFTVCDNWTTAKTQQCKTAGSTLAGTGYEASDILTGNRVGGGTGWLTTTVPVDYLETITLRFIIFDEGDHVYDSAVVLDNFVWSLNAASGPVTIP
jgi:hypothetical protein